MMESVIKEEKDSGICSEGGDGCWNLRSGSKCKVESVVNELMYDKICSRGRDGWDFDLHYHEGQNKCAPKHFFSNIHTLLTSIYKDLETDLGSPELVVSPYWAPSPSSRERWL